MTPETNQHEAGSGCPTPTCSASFTPGPWTIGDENNQHIEVCIGDAVATLDRQDRYGMHMVFPREEMRLNGKLMAAAPDMLAALIELRDAPWLNMPERANELVENAINKALEQNVVTARVSNNNLCLTTKAL